MAAGQPRPRLGYPARGLVGRGQYRLAGQGRPPRTPGQPAHAAAHPRSGAHPARRRVAGGRGRPEGHLPRHDRAVAAASEARLCARTCGPLPWGGILCPDLWSFGRTRKKWLARPVRQVPGTWASVRHLAQGTWRLLQRPHPLGLPALWPLLSLEVHLLALGQFAIAGTVDGGEVGEHIGAAVVRCDETEALRRVEPFHCPKGHVATSPSGNHASVTCRTPREASKARGQHDQGRAQQQPTTMAANLASQSGTGPPVPWPPGGQPPPPGHRYLGHQAVSHRHRATGTTTGPSATGPKMGRLRRLVYNGTTTRSW